MISWNLASATCNPTFVVDFGRITEPCLPSSNLDGGTKVGYVPKCQCFWFGVMWKFTKLWSTKL